MKIANNTASTEAEIRQRKVVGYIKNNWRMRDITLFESNLPGMLYMIGDTFDKTLRVISLERIGMNERLAMNLFPKVLVRD